MWGHRVRGSVSFEPGDRAPLQQVGERLRTLSAGPRLDHSQVHRLAGLALDLALVTSARVPVRVGARSRITARAQDGEGERVIWDSGSPARLAHVAVAFHCISPRWIVLDSETGQLILPVGHVEGRDLVDRRPTRSPSDLLGRSCSTPRIRSG